MAARPAAAAAEPDRHTCPPSRCAGHNLPDVDAMPLPNSSTTHAAITYGRFICTLRAQPRQRHDHNQDSTDTRRSGATATAVAPVHPTLMAVPVV